MPWRIIVDIVGFQSTWWASALGAGAGLWAPGVGVAAVVAVIQLWLAREHRGGLLTIMVVAAVLAVVAESLIVASGLVRYAAAWPSVGLAPLWIVALWVIFATCIPATAHMLGQRAVALSVPVGAIIAPPTYYAGVALGALTFAEPMWQPLAATALVWAIATPILVAVWRGRLAEDRRSAVQTGSPPA